MKQELEQSIAAVVQQVFNEAVDVVLTRPDEQFGDYATNVALQLAQKVGENPRQIADELAAGIRENSGDKVADVSVAGPGFINLKVSDQMLLAAAAQASKTRTTTYEKQVVVAEYSDANPFKVFHAGHVYTTVIGDAIATLHEMGGATVHRVNFGGDVGLHVAKTMWAIIDQFGGEYPDKMQAIPESERALWLSARYVAGHHAYEDNEVAKEAITAINKRVYQIHTDNDHESPFAQIYWLGRAWSYEAFDAFYARLGTKLEKYYPESEVADLGLQTVKAHIGDVFEESEGAVVFKAEKYGLHTRVFINKQGLPTYEAKDVGLIFKKYDDYHFDRSVIVTDNEQEQYMQVVLKAIEQFRPDLVKLTKHIPHGKLKLPGGVKMSSRLGNIVPALEVLDLTAAALRAANRDPNDAVLLGAVRYALLKLRIGGDPIYDPKESIALEGNSGPYIQYAHARARSVLAKANGQSEPSKDLEAGERRLASKIAEYADVLEKAIVEIMPHYICTYLYELAQAFNAFYEHNRVIGNEREGVGLQLVKNYADRLKAGLELLGITAPDKM